MEKKNKNLSKKEYHFSKSYYKRKRKLLERAFGGKPRRKKVFYHGKKGIIYYNVKITRRVV